MSDSEDPKPTITGGRDEVLDLFERLTSRVEAALDHDDVSEVAFLLSERDKCLNALLIAAADDPFPASVVERLEARNAELEARLLKARNALDGEAQQTQAKARAARLYVKNS